MNRSHRPANQQPLTQTTPSSQNSRHLTISIREILGPFRLWLCCISLIQPAFLCTLCQIVRDYIEIHARRKVNRKQLYACPFIRCSELLQTSKNLLFLIESVVKEDDMNRPMPTAANDLGNNGILILIGSQRPNHIEVINIQSVPWRIPHFVKIVPHLHRPNALTTYAILSVGQINDDLHKLLFRIDQLRLTQTVPSSAASQSPDAHKPAE